MKRIEQEERDTRKIGGTGLVLLALFLFCVFLAGCVGARGGVSGQTLVRVQYPRASITANAPLVLQGYARKWVSLPTDFLGVEPTGVMDYAVYGQEESGLVTRHAHAFFVKPSSDHAWYFRPESYKAPGGLAIGVREMEGYRWTAQIIRVDGETDWFSAMWAASGFAVPETWLARRFSATPERSTRVVAEYRELWPECLDPEAKDLVFVRKECLQGFLERSDAAFTLRIFTPGEPGLETPPSVLQKPSFAPDMKKLAGELMERDTFFRRWR